MTRATMSTPPPGVSGTMMRTGRTGYGCAPASAIPRDKAKGTRHKAMLLRRVTASPGYCVSICRSIGCAVRPECERSVAVKIRARYALVLAPHRLQAAGCRHHDLHRDVATRAGAQCDQPVAGFSRLRLRKRIARPGDEVHQRRIEPIRADGGHHAAARAHLGEGRSALRREIRS